MKAPALITVAMLLAGAAASAQDVNDSARHPSLGLGALQLELVARVHLDARSVQRQTDDEDEMRELDIARRRVGVRGRLTRVAAFEVEAEVAAPDPWRDVYIDYRQFRALRVRAGHFKVPFSLDYTTSSANLDFIDRARGADRLSIGRERGVMAYGRLWDERLKYEVGSFGGGRTTAVRVTGRPLGSGRSPIGPLSTAVAYATGTIDERRVESVWVNGVRRRAGLELEWKPGPVTVTAEYMRAIDERRGQGLAGDDLSPLVRVGWYLTGAWAVVPDARGSRPRLELAARVDALRAGSNGPGAEASFSPRALVVAGRDERAVTVGLNWYVVPRVKLQANAVRDRASSAPMRWMPAVRLQVSL